MRIDQGANRCYSSFVYVKYTTMERKQLWITLYSFGGNIYKPWFVAEDLNTVLSEEGRIGCHSSRGSTVEFNNFVLGVGLLDAGYNGNKYSWSIRVHGINFKWTRHDNFLINGDSR